MSTSKVIYKYPLEVKDIQEIVVSSGAEILTVQIQYGVPCLWALVNSDPKSPRRKYDVLLVGTGNPIPDSLDIESWDYVDTVLMSSEQLVLHVFVRPKEI